MQALAIWPTSGFPETITNGVPCAAAGIPEELITGKDSDPKERFLAWAKTVPSHDS
jgi:hypothetical protein